MNPLALLFCAYCILGAAYGLLAVLSLRFDRGELNRVVSATLAVFAVWLLASGLQLQATDDGTFWVSANVAATARSLSVTLGGLALAAVTGAGGLKRWLALSPLGVGSAVGVGLIWTGHGFVAAYHHTAWGNVATTTGDAGVLAFGTALYLGSQLTTLWFLAWGWFRQRTKAQRTILAYLTVLSVGGTLWVDFVTPEVWQAWGWPDLTTLGFMALNFVFYSYLIGRFRHLSEDRPDFSDLLIAQLRGLVLFVNRRGVVVQASAKAAQLLGLDLAKDVKLSEVLRGWDGEAGKNPLSQDLTLDTESSGTLDGRRYRLRLIPHENLFYEFDGAIVRLIPDGSFEEVVEEYLLSPREHEVAALLVQGMDHRQISEAMFISPGTVRNHLHRLYQKTGTKSRADLTRLLLQGRSGLIE
jgi:DNA-binding CsgD family transcriptional regulator